MLCARRMVGLSLLLGITSGCVIPSQRALDQCEAEKDKLLAERNQLERELTQTRGRAQSLEARVAELTAPENAEATPRPAVSGADTTPEPQAPTGSLPPRGFEGMPLVHIAKGRADELRLVIESGLFGAGSATPTKRGREVLDQIAAVLRRDFPGYAVRVDGHTDASPPSKVKAIFPTNWHLSAARASAVMDFFISQKAIDPTRAQVAAFGAERPIADNETEEGRTANRRVELLIRSSSG